LPPPLIELDDVAGRFNKREVLADDDDDECLALTTAVEEEEEEDAPLSSIEDSDDDDDDELLLFIVPLPLFEESSGGELVPVSRNSWSEPSAPLVRSDCAIVYSS